MTKDGICLLDIEMQKGSHHHSLYGSGQWRGVGHVEELVLNILTVQPRLKGSVFD